MKKIIYGILFFLLTFTTCVSAQNIIVKSEFSLDIDYNNIESVLMLIKDSLGEEHVITNNIGNNFTTNEVIADGEYSIESYVVKGDYTLEYPIIVNTNKEVYPNVITMKVTKKGSTLNPTNKTTTKKVEIDYEIIETDSFGEVIEVISPTSSTTTNTTTNKKEQKDESKSRIIYTIVLISIPVIFVILLLIYGVFKFILTIR